MSIGLGDKVRDPITGYEGIVIAYNRWMNGCDRVAVQSQKLKDGKPAESEWFDVVQIELVKAGVFKPVPSQVPSKTTGGPNRGDARSKR